MSDHQFTSGYMFSLGSSKKQPIVALSSTHVEYRDATVAIYEPICLRRLQDIRIGVSTPILIYFDNISSMQLAKYPMFHAHNKHIEVYHHIVHERVLSGEDELWYVRMVEWINKLSTSSTRCSEPISCCTFRRCLVFNISTCCT